MGGSPVKKGPPVAEVVLHIPEIRPKPGFLSGVQYFYFLRFSLVLLISAPALALVDRFTGANSITRGIFTPAEWYDYVGEGILPGLCRSYRFGNKPPCRDERGRALRCRTASLAVKGARLRQRPLCELDVAGLSATGTRRPSLSSSHLKQRKCTIFSTASGAHESGRDRGRSYLLGQP